MGLFGPSGGSQAVVRTLYIRFVAACYACAFFSLYLQIPGLYGPRGILTADPIVNVRAYESSNNFFGYPSFWGLLKGLGLSPQTGLEVLCLSGTLVGILSAILPRMCCKLGLGFLWLAYLSVYGVGQTFLHFQWDILLLESGFLAFAAAPLTPTSWWFLPRHRDRIVMTLVRWLLFRMMFASGVVKLQSDCPTWWGLTALPLHYESQCIPTPFAWHAYNLGSFIGVSAADFLHRLSVVITYVIEIPAVFLFFAPTHGLRKVTFFLQFLLMTNIMLTGNYNFFNLNYIALCLSLLDDNDLRKRKGFLTRYPTRSISKRIISILKSCFNVVVLGIMFFFTVTYFISVQSGSIHPSVKFTKSEFENFVEYGATLGMILGAISLAAACITSIFKSTIYGGADGSSRTYNTVSSIWHSVVAVTLFALSLQTFFDGLRKPLPAFTQPLLSQPLVRKIHQDLDKWELVHSYGLFRRMTGVGGRPELVIEGSMKSHGPWKEYHFFYKPGDVTAAPRFVLPHHPRLDWQMWFAALGSYEYNPWLLSLIYRILQNESDVLKLLDEKRNPFPQTGPKYVRVKRYLYHFTGSTNNHEASEWWYREGEETYLETLSSDDQRLNNYLIEVGLLTSQASTTPRLSDENTKLRKFLDWFRELCSQVEPHVPVWTIALIFFQLLSYIFVGI